jgi:hypothetical protein
MITVKIDKKNETVTYSTLLKIDGKLMSLRVLRYLGYQKPYQLNHKLPLPDDLLEKKITLFEDLFYWPEEFYTNPKRNHLAYINIFDSDYHYQSKKSYEINWEEIKVYLNPKNNGALILSNKTDWHMIAIPPASEGEQRYDYITDDNMYHYNCKQGQYKGIEIFLDGLKKTISW